MRTVRFFIALQRESGLAQSDEFSQSNVCFYGACPLRPQRIATGPVTGWTARLHPKEALPRQARTLQQSGSLAEHRERHVVVEHRLARLMQFRIRQAHDFGRVAIRSRLYLAAKVELTGKSGRIPAPELPSPITASLGLRQFWSLTLLESVLLPQAPGFRAEDANIHIVPLENKQL